MPNEKYKVELTEEEVKSLKEITHKGNTSSARTIMHANVLLQTNDVSPNKKTDREIAEMFSISKTTVNQIRKTYATEGLKSALLSKNEINSSDFIKNNRRVWSACNCCGLKSSATRTGEMDIAVISWTLYGKTIHCIHFICGNWGNA